eukprot:9476937-Pyramimonas_sp.AAC.1
MKGHASQLGSPCFEKPVCCKQLPVVDVPGWCARFGIECGLIGQLQHVIPRQALPFAITEAPQAPPSGGVPGAEYRCQGTPVQHRAWASHLQQLSNEGQVFSVRLA